MIALEAVQLRRLADDVLRQLQVDDSVRVIDVHDLSDGTWTVDFEDRWPETRFPAFALEVQQDWSRDQAARELRMVAARQALDLSAVSARPGSGGRGLRRVPRRCDRAADSRSSTPTSIVSDWPTRTI